MWKIFGEKRLPWTGRPTILSAVKEWDGRSDLPDEDSDSSQVHFSTGALDNVRLRHFGLDPDPQTARLFRALERAVTRGSEDDRATLYRLMVQHPAVDHAEALAARVESSSLDREPVAELARWLLNAAADREPAKYALILLALCGAHRDAELVMTFARHDEFTMFAASAIERVSDDPLAAELAMAEQVHGWGKISLVERVAERGGDRADVRDWLLRRGCPNAVMDEYLGYACASAGRLHEALAAETIDAELRASACTIVNALVIGGPARDIHDYEHGAEAIEHLLRHIEGTTDLRELATVATISRWLGHEQDWRTAEVREHLAARARAFFAGIEDRVRASFRGEDRVTRFCAWNVAAEAGIDLWEDAFELAQRGPLAGYLYQWLVRDGDPMRLRRTITLAEQNLPLDRIATGPALQLFIGGDDHDAFLALDVVLQSLPRRGQFSARLTAAALRSPVTRHRHLAKHALEKTPRDEWGEELTALLARAAAEEPDEKLKRELNAMLGR